MQLPWRLFGAIVLLWCLIGFVPLLVWSDLHTAADFANTFGFVNALFGALAFGGVIWAIRLQTKELELQRSEIEESRDELRRSADAQHQSQQMHFLSALLLARNNVAQGYAAAAARETGPMRCSEIAHKQHLAELEWLLHRVDRHESNPFALPAGATVVAHQLALMLMRAHPLLSSAIANRASNHARNLLLDLNQSFRDLRRMLADDAAEEGLQPVLDGCIARAETVNVANDFDEIAETCIQVFNDLSIQVSTMLSAPVPTLPCCPVRQRRDEQPAE